MASLAEPLDRRTTRAIISLSVDAYPNGRAVCQLKQSLAGGFELTRMLELSSGDVGWLLDQLPRTLRRMRSRETGGC